MSIRKIIVALVIAFAVVGLTGVASAGYSSYTDIRGTHFSSSSRTQVSGMPVNIGYTQSFEAILKADIFPPSDFGKTNIQFRGTDFSLKNTIRSSPTQNTVTTIVGNPSDVSGTMTRRNCALLQQSIESVEVSFPQPVYQPTASRWWGRHSAGAAYPGRSTERYSISWP